MKKKSAYKASTRRRNNRTILAVISILILALFLFFYVFKSVPMWGEADIPEQVLPEKKSDFTIEGSLVFYNSNQDSVTAIDIEIADDPYSRQKGMMFRHYIPDTVGMLFVFPKEYPRSFWMKDTPSSLDIYYADENREIIRIYENAPPFSEESLPSGDPAKYVIEVGAGFTARHNIKQGYRFSYTEFTP